MSQPTTTNLDYATIPLDSIGASSYAGGGRDPTKMLDGDLSTFWKPLFMERSWVRINFLKPHLVREVDLAFRDGDKKRYVFEVSVLSTTHPGNRWVSLNTYETGGDTTDPVRHNIPDVVTGAVRLTFISFTENGTGNMGILPEVSEVRINGEITEDELPASNEIKKLPKCPKGYEMDRATGLCKMRGAVYDRLEPSVVEGKIMDKTKKNNPTLDNLQHNVIDGNPDTGFTMVGVGSSITQKFDREVDVYSVNIDIVNPTVQTQYHLVLDLGRKQVPVMLQPDLISTEVVLDEPVRTKSVGLILGGTTDPSPQQRITITRMEVSGNPNPTKPKRKKKTKANDK